MKRLIATRSNSNISDMTDITHPVIKNYAKKCKAEFMVLDDDKGLHPHYRILQFKELFKNYDYILSVDSDILINNNTPNVFEMVPPNMVGSIYEDVGSRKEHRRSLIQKIQEERGYVGWDEGYINTGFALFPKSQKGIFNRIDTDNLWMDFGLDDVEICYQIHSSRVLSDSTYQIYELPFKYNHMIMFNEPWNNSPSRFNSYVIHYAGNGIFSNSVRNRQEQIEQDYHLMKKYNLI